MPLYNPLDSTAIIDETITTSDILDGTIAASDLGTGAVTSAKILDGTITTSDVDTSSFDARYNPFGFPFTVDPGICRSSDAMPLPASNAAIFARCRDGGTITKVGLQVVVSSGNISVAAYRNSGTGRNAVPGTQLLSSGAVACPGTGYQEVSLGGSATLAPGDWLALSADNTTATFLAQLSTAADSNLGLGRQFRQATAHPLSGTPSSLTARVGNTVVLIGVP